MLAVCGGRQKGKKRSLRGHPAPGRELAARCISAKLSLFPILQQPCYQLTVSIEGKKNSCFTTESDHKMTIQNFVIYRHTLDESSCVKKEKPVSLRSKSLGFSQSKLILHLKWDRPG